MRATEDCGKCSLMLQMMATTGRAGDAMCRAWNLVAASPGGAKIRVRPEEGEGAASGQQNGKWADIGCCFYSISTSRGCGAVAARRQSAFYSGLRDAPGIVDCARVTPD